MIQRGMKELRKAAWEEIVEQVHIIVSDSIESVEECRLICTEQIDIGECRLICTEQIDIGREYVKFDRERPSCDCSATVEELQGQPAIYKATINDLAKQISTTVPLPPLCKERFVSDDFTLTHWFAKFESTDSYLRSCE